MQQAQFTPNEPEPEQPRDNQVEKQQAVKKQVPPSKSNPLALMNLDGAPTKEEFHEMIVKWKKSGYFALRQRPRQGAKIVGQIKASKGTRLTYERDVTHILKPVKELEEKDFEEIISHTFTRDNRKHKKRALILKRGDPVYTYRYDAEGTFLVGAHNRYDKTFTFFYSGGDRTPDMDDPKQVQWWLYITGEKNKKGWLMYKPADMNAKQQMMEGILPSMN